jgi:hypothetical protein
MKTVSNSQSIKVQIKSKSSYENYSSQIQKPNVNRSHSLSTSIQHAQLSSHAAKSVFNKFTTQYEE